MSHTPGPWTAVEMTHYGAPGTGFWSVQPVGEPDDTWSEADARLAAAAPELYAAAKALVAEIFIDEDTEQDDPLITMRYIRQLRDAIAKAEGR